MLGRLVLAAALFAVLLPTTESCLPSWLREERSTDEEEAVVEKDAEHVVDEAVNEVQEVIDDDYDDPVVEKTINEAIKFVETKKEKSEEDDFYFDFEIPDVLPEAMKLEQNPEVEKAKRDLSEVHCVFQGDNYCFYEGECVIHVHEETYKFVGMTCKCKPGYHGTRCEIPYVESVYSPVMARPGSRTHMLLSPAAIGMFLLLIVSVSITVYLYKKVRRSRAGPQNPLDHMTSTPMIPYTKRTNREKKRNNASYILPIMDPNGRLARETVVPALSDSYKLDRNKGMRSAKDDRTKKNFDHVQNQRNICHDILHHGKNYESRKENIEKRVFTGKEGSPRHFCGPTTLELATVSAHTGKPIFDS